MSILHVNSYFECKLVSYLIYIIYSFIPQNTFRKKSVSTFTPNETKTEEEKIKISLQQHIFLELKFEVSTMKYIDNS